MRKVVDAKIISNEKIADTIYRIVLQNQEVASAVEPGQFVNVYLNDKSLLLPRPISICFSDEDQITLVYRIVGKGTKELSEYGAGEVISISTTLGHGYYLDLMFEDLLGDERKELKSIALTAGGLGIPPMLELAKIIRERISTDKAGQIRLIAALGFQKEVFLADELKEFCDEVFIATEQGNIGFQGNVLEMMEAEKLKPDYFLSCGPKPMLKALADYCGVIGKPIQVSLEERMGCGYGACVGCTCKTRNNQSESDAVHLKKVCKDGPVFFGNEVVWDE